MKTIIILFALVPLALFFASCKENLSNLKVVQEQTTGNFKVAVLSEDGIVRQGAGSFVVEFRNVSDNGLVKVGSVSSEARMQMAGAPMIGETSIEFTDIPGRYNAKCNFSDKGKWIYTVFFNNGLKVQFILNVM